MLQGYVGVPLDIDIIDHQRTIDNSTQIITTPLRIIHITTSHDFRIPINQSGFQRTQVVFSVRTAAAVEKKPPGLWESDLSSESSSAADMQRQGMHLGGMNGVGILRE